MHQALLMGTKGGSSVMLERSSTELKITIPPGPNLWPILWYVAFIAPAFYFGGIMLGLGAMVVCTTFMSAVGWSLYRSQESITIDSKRFCIVCDMPLNILMAKFLSGSGGRVVKGDVSQLLGAQIVDRGVRGEGGAVLGTAMELYTGFGKHRVGAMLSTPEQQQLVREINSYVEQLMRSEVEGPKDARSLPQLMDPEGTAQMAPSLAGPVPGRLFERVEAAQLLDTQCTRPAGSMVILRTLGTDGGQGQELHISARPKQHMVWLVFWFQLHFVYVVDVQRFDELVETYNLPDPIIIFALVFPLVGLIMFLLYHVRPTDRVVIGPHKFSVTSRGHSGTPHAGCMHNQCGAGHVEGRTEELLGARVAPTGLVDGKTWRWAVELVHGSGSVRRFGSYLDLEEQLWLAHKINSHMEHISMNKVDFQALPPLKAVPCFETGCRHF